ncbi:MAG: hypothetical protein HY336_00310 [Candidatus Doudnabacteria bacterium]|nr:hypothetical protein [Candidatus Doudnabacteria bacterium]
MTETNPHFVCPACNSVSENVKSCATEACILEGKTMATCNCDDGKHEEVKQTA